MTTSVLSLISLWFQSAWQLLTCCYIPGTNVTPAGLLIFIPSAVIGINLFKKLFGGS